MGTKTQNKEAYPTNQRGQPTIIGDQTTNNAEPTLKFAKINNDRYYGSPVFRQVFADDHKQILVLERPNNENVVALNGNTGIKVWNHTLPGYAIEQLTLADIDVDGNQEAYTIVNNAGEHDIWRIDYENGVKDFTIAWANVGGIKSLVAGKTSAGQSGKGLIGLDGKDNRVHVLNGDDNGATRSAYSMHGLFDYSTALHDFENDGSPELIFSQNNTLLLNDVGSQRFLMNYTLPSYTQSDKDPTLNQIYFPTVVDFDNDGNEEIVVTRSTGSLFMFESSGYLRYHIPIPESNPDPAVGDINVDGKNELILTSELGTISIFDGATGEMINYTNYDYKFDSAVTLADVDADDILDLLIGTKSGSVVAIDGISKEVIWNFDVTESDHDIRGDPVIGNIDSDPELELAFHTVDSTFSNYTLIVADLPNTGRIYWQGASGDSQFNIARTTKSFDSDMDGLEDAFESEETMYSRDVDDDNLPDAFERFQIGTDPTMSDTDGDGIDDDDELNGQYKTDPTKADTDGDGLTDSAEYKHNTNPLKSDTDGDGINDGDEVANGSDPNNAADGTSTGDNDNGDSNSTLNASAETVTVTETLIDEESTDTSEGFLPFLIYPVMIAMVIVVLIKRR